MAGRQSFWEEGRRAGGQAEAGVLLRALLRNRRGSRPESLGLGVHGALHFISASSGAKIDIETEGST